MNLTVPPAQVDINESVIKGLIDDQFPQFSSLEISFLDSGWDNENYRLGSDYIIRLPRRAAAIPLLQNEMNWLPKLKSALPIGIPAPIYIGKPNEHYPWQWTIIPWYQGMNGCVNQPGNVQILYLVDFLKKLHSQPIKDAPYNDHRCLPLLDKSDEVVDRINRLKSINDKSKSRLLHLWHQSIVEPMPDQKCLIHGDMHPRNIIIHQGEINALIDWGDMTAGDVATDLASIWMLFDDAQVRASGFAHYRADPSLINRSRGWAIFFGTLFLELGTAADGEYQIAGERILNNIQG